MAASAVLSASERIWSADGPWARSTNTALMPGQAAAKDQRPAAHLWTMTEGSRSGL
jgi:hypothetical protein